MVDSIKVSGKPEHLARLRDERLPFRIGGRAAAAIRERVPGEVASAITASSFAGSSARYRRR